MSTQTRRQLKQEADLLNRFADAYRGKFEHMIGRLNTAPTDSATPTAADNDACIRLCVETLGMLLATQTHLADALRALSQDEPRRAA